MWVNERVFAVAIGDQIARLWVFVWRKKNIILRRIDFRPKRFDRFKNGFFEPSIEDILTANTASPIRTEIKCTRRVMKMRGDIILSRIDAGTKVSRRTELERARLICADV